MDVEEGLEESLQFLSLDHVPQVSSYVRSHDSSTDLSLLTEEIK